MSISILGAGNVGQALASAFIRQGKSIVFGVNDPAKYRDTVVALGEQAAVGSVAEAIDANNVVILAVPYAAAESIAKSVPNWQEKILVDATNPLDRTLSGLTIGTTTSGAEEIAKAAINARVVKAFNTTGAENMRNSQYPGGAPFMPVCGDDPEAKDQVLALVSLIGFEAVDLGGLRSARFLEPFAMTWIYLAIKMGQGRDFAFGLLNRT